MKVIKRSDIIKKVPLFWERTYGLSNPITIRLNTEKPTTEKQIADIIGNDTWVSNACSECKKECEVTIELGELLDYDSATVHICMNCLTKAVDTIKQA